MSLIKTYDIVTKTGARFSPNNWRTTMALAHKGIEIDCQKIGFTDIPGICDGERKIVPTIEHGETLLSDSWAIAEYLEDQFPKAPSLFGGAQGKAHARFINEWANTNLHPQVIRVVLLDIYNSLPDKDREYFRTSRENRFGMTLEAFAEQGPAAAKALKAVLMPMAKTLQTQAFLGGETPTYADYIAFGAFQWVRTVSTFDLAGIGGEPVQAWLERTLDLHGGLGRSEPAASS